MNIKEEISKILEKAASTNSEAEANALLGKAKAMMEEHQIEAFELGAEPFITEVTNPFQKGTSAQIRYRVQAQVAEYYGCSPILVEVDWKGTKKQAVYELHGPESALITAKLMTPFVWEQVLAAARNEAKTRAWTPQEEKTMARKYTASIADALIIRLRRLRATEPEPEARTEAGRNALVVIGNALEQYVQSRYSDLRPAKTRKNKATSRAMQLANGISLGLQVDGGDGTRLLS
jgi:Protein of unknown function (DUF2786)